MKLAGIVTGVLVSGYASFAMAQAAAVVKPRPVTQAPKVAPRPASPALSRAMESARGTGQSLESLRAAQTAGAGAAVVANDNKAVEACSVAEFSNGTSKDTGYQASDVEYLVEQQLITQGTCGGAKGVVGYPVEARKNLIAAAKSVSENVLKGRKASELSGVEIRGLDMAWAQGLADAKNRNAANDNQVTVESQLEVARQIKTECGLRRN